VNRSIYSYIVFAFVLAFIGPRAFAAASDNPSCVDVNRSENLTFEGTLAYHIFPGLPNYEDVRKGDRPEPAYILNLSHAICTTGDEAADSIEKVDRIQLLSDDTGRERSLWHDLRTIVGQQVHVEGKSAFAAHTMHHHAPLLVTIETITAGSHPTAGYGTAMTTVEAFYLALEAGNGDEAATFVVPQKRQPGPLSARAISLFYGNLLEPLRLLDVTPVQPDEYRVRYTFVAQGARRCNGTVIVKTTQIEGANLIESIRAVEGC
jgi:hypothetical protein